MGGRLSRSILVSSLVMPLVWLFSKPPLTPPPHVQNIVTSVTTPPPPLDNNAPPPPPPLADNMQNITKPLQQQQRGQKSVKEIIEEARQQIGVDCIRHYNFGVCGQSGVGKSSFINGFLGLEGDDACSVGEVETTQKIKKYSTTKTPYLMVWDIPAAGTTSHPAETYFEDKKLYVFDAILILFSERFLKADFDILRLARKYKTPCVFVRTKCDIGVESRATRDRINAFEASQRFQKDVRANFLEGLIDAGLYDASSTPELFFINNHFFLDDDAYSIYDRRNRKLDTSLSFMDEYRLSSFIHDTAKLRDYPPK